MQPEFYVAITDRLIKEFGLTVDKEHEFVTEFSEGPLPLFKLIMATTSENETIMMVSFHIELDAPTAIQWFLRIRQLDPNLYIASSYLKDAHGESHVGDDAEILRMYMIEQDVITAYMASNKEAADVLGRELVPSKPSPIKIFNTYRQALVEFQKMQKKKGDISH